jgi:hypothetical protein
MRPEIVAHRYMAAVLGAAEFADMDMDLAAPVIRDEQAKTGGGQVGWIETTKAESFKRRRKRRLVLDLGQDDFDVKDVAGRHPRYCRRSDVFHGHHVRHSLRQDSGQAIEVMPPAIAMTDDPMEIHAILRPQRSGPSAPAPGIPRDSTRHFLPAH